MSVTPEMLSLGLSATVLACILVPGLLTAATPWLMPRGEVFAVTVPVSAARDPRLLVLRRRYAAVMVALTLVLGTVAVLHAKNVTLLVAASLLLPAVGFFGMLACRSRVLALKRSEGWQVEGSRSTAVALPKEAPGAIPLRWNLLYVPIVLATAALTAVLYPLMPDRIVMQVGFDGQVTSWADKSVWSASFPVLTQAFVAVMFAACHVAALHSKRAGSAATPVATAMRYGAFAQAETIVLLGTGLALTAGLALFPLADAGLIDLLGAGLAVMALTLVALVASILVAVRYGQVGARLDGVPSEASSGDDVHWKAGIFYVNPGDPSIVVPRRFGIGWTLNLGNWRSWLALAALVGATVLFCVGVSMI